MQPVLPDGSLKVWWKPQIPCASFEVVVATPYEGRKLLDILADYDIFQLEHKIKPDYCNAGGLMQLIDGEWVDWEDDYGRIIDELDESDFREAL